MIAVYIGAEPRFGRPNRTVSHLQACPTCARRYQELIGQLADLRDDGAAEVDAIFTPERLEAQRDQILARLEHAMHPARVIPFPSHGSPRLSIFTQSQVRRWIAAAAAAGLLIGLTLGRLDFGTVTPGGSHAAIARPVPPPDNPGVHPPAVPPGPNEEDILSRAEQAQAQGEMQVPASLEALSAITPGIRDAALRLPPRH